MRAGPPAAICQVAKNPYFSTVFRYKPVNENDGSKSKEYIDENDVKHENPLFSNGFVEIECV